MRPFFDSSDVAQHFTFECIGSWSEQRYYIFAKILYEKCTLQYFSALYYHSMPIVHSLCTSVSQVKSTLQYFSNSVFQYFSISVFLYFHFRPIAIQFVHKRLLHKSNPIQTSAQAQNSFLLLLRRCDEEKDRPNICISSSMNTIIVLKLIGRSW